MPDTLYEEFYDPTVKYQNESRSFCYELCSSMIIQSKNDISQSWYTNTKTIQAILLLEYCWNFSSKKTKELTLSSVFKVLHKNEESLRQLEQYSFLTLPENLENKIRTIFSSFSRTFDQTGTSKALSLLNAPLFVMWDTKIRRRLNKELIKGIDNGQTGDQYILFLRRLRGYNAQHNFQQKLSPHSVLAKKIDEYHYIRIVLGL